MTFCIHCGKETHVPDEKTGEIHVNGLYACFQGVKMTDPRWELTAQSGPEVEENQGVDWFQVPAI